ncbi:hypothetical protein [Ruegeria sp. HKCCA4008]|uniref:type VI toxin-antitoxin system SocB family DNA replication inhibitor toxin n=1 Tax=Ruegeria sp. HKCCA4008 TaxID=2682999 RepID=UPI001C2C405F|nr:hypothetical protein [Ruegeria sp. HKCCA4008]
MPDIDLARIAPLPDAEKRHELEKFKLGNPSINYKPLRSNFSDILNVRPEMFDRIDPTELSVIERKVKRQARWDKEELANLRVVRGLHALAQEKKVIGRRQEFYPFQMRMGWKVSLWLPTILAIDEAPYATFIDPRGNRGLNDIARQFAFSMMHERIRVEDPDFEEVRLSIVKFGQPTERHAGDKKKGFRPARFFTDEGVDLIPLDELERMVATTYEIWREVSEGREQEARRRAAGAGPLFGD